MTHEQRTEALKQGLDVDDTLERLGGDEALLVELAGIMVDDSPAMLSSLRAAVELGEANDLRAAAHKAKGALAVFGPGSACRMAGELESFGVNGEIAEARRTFPAFEAEMGRMLAALSQIASAA